MKRITFIIVGLLFLVVQGISADDLDAFNGDCNIGIGKENPVLVFQNNNPKSSRAGGENWVAPLPSGKKHVFTINVTTNGVNSWDNKVDELHIVALNALLDGTYGRVNESNFDGTNFKSSIIVAENYISIPNDGNNYELSIEVSETYNIVFLYSTKSGKIKINSFTRTEENAGTSVAAPTITPASSTYDGDLSVTITKGEGNAKVVYSVSGATTGNATDAEFTTSSQVLNLTGTGTITVTATGYDGEDNASSDVTNTYTYSIPSGQSSTTSGLPHTFNSWDEGNSITFNNSFFSNIETGDYVVFDVANVAQNGTVLGFRDSWNESPYVDCTTTSGGNGAKGTLNIGDTQWWMKVNSDVVNSLKNHEVRMQGGMIPKEVAGTSDDVTSSIKLNSIDVYKSFAISEAVDNNITKYDNVVVELTRSFVADTWNTVCLPFALTSDQATQLFGSGYKVAAFTGVNNEIMQFTTLSSNDDFEAGVPYLVNPTKNLSNSSPVVLIDVDLTAKNGSTVTYDGYSFVGTLVQKTFTENLDYTRFVASGNELKKPNSGSTLKALRAYFILPASFDHSHAPKLSIDGEGEATEIISLDNERVIMDNVYYDLSGRRVMNPTKGLYIVNGRKVIIK